MRNVPLVLLTALALSGCLDSGDSGFVDGNSAVDNSTSNNAPSIGGNPSTAIMVDDKYEFIPSASDDDGDSLTFQISNRPSWAEFDRMTGRLSGQPTLGDVGTYENIVITVSDGIASRSLKAFTITVSQSALGSVTLSWTAPTENSDGSPLMDLAGYKIYYGRSSGDYDHEIRLESPGITTYVVEQLVPDTYYFAATAFNSVGVESQFSDEAIRAVN